MFVRMKNIVALRTLKAYWEKNPETELHLVAWYNIARAMNWTTPAQVKMVYRDASILKNGRVVFNIKGNEYRLVVKINYRRGWIYIRFVGTHVEYDNIDANTV